MIFNTSQRNQKSRIKYAAAAIAAVARIVAALEIKGIRTDPPKAILSQFPHESVSPMLHQGVEDDWHTHFLQTLVHPL